jgi:hypothetical protein
MKKLIAPLCALFLIGPAAAGAQPPARMQHPEARDMPLPARAQARARTAEEMRSGSAWGVYGGMSANDRGGDYQGVGGPDEGEEESRAYPRCRSRSDDRCRQGR